MSVIQERIIILQNSVKFLELIVQKLRGKNITFLTEKIQKRIKSYKEELQLHEDFIPFKAMDPNEYEINITLKS